MNTAAPVRIQKFLADAGLCSRRAAESLVAEGAVWVNGARAAAGLKVVPGADKVTVNGRVVLPPAASAPPKLTLAVHKPRGLVCSNDDPHNPRTIFDLLPRALARRRLFCAGRLDKDSEGLVILTTDGDLANRLMHPSNAVVKRYHVALKKPFPRALLPRLLRGVTVENERLKVEHAFLVNPDAGGASPDLDVHMGHGKKREIRLLFSTLGFDVRRLKRYQIGAFQLRGIPSGAVKPLSPADIDRLFQLPGPHPDALRLAGQAAAKHRRPPAGKTPA
ncbi:MAG: rRNA pseudouridine synthase [Opitutaceae bacterium]|jgi:23S rRNA pseudouridine2605 synthase|nr:rRNA pseudouridine synthase [Opitutaceae bacterium]